MTITEIGRRAQVSKATVSRVLNGKPDVDEVTASRVRRVIAETGYTPSARAVSLARGRSRTIGMLVPSLSWPWMADVLRGVADTVESARYGLLLHTVNHGEESLERFATHVSARSFDGLVAVEPPHLMRHISELHRRGLPVVLIDDRGNHPGFPSVSTTNEAGGADAARHLLALGRTTLACIAGPPEYGCTTARLRGFQRVLVEHGREPAHRRVHFADFTERGGYRAMDQLIADGAPVDGVFVHNDLMAFGALRRLAEADLRVPDRVAVIGFDNIPAAAQVSPALTTVAQPSYEMGRVAARMLLYRLNGRPQANEQAVLPTTLVCRQTAPLVGH